MATIRNKDGKIFISYRRADAYGIAGRLSDTLGAYFGDDRVFRDIEDIAGGADFGNVIEQNIQAADAVIILINREWLSICDGNGRPRIHDPADWVAQEISIAIKLGLPLFPVLIEDTPMPRAAELPENLRPILRYNAISVSDKRWKTDILQLGRIISINIPSASERKLNTVRAIISIGLFAAFIFSTTIFSWFSIFPDSNVKFELWESGVPFIAIVASTLLLLSIVNLVDEDRRGYIYAGIFSGALGSLLFFILLIPVEDLTKEPVVTFLGSAITVSLMFVFMNMSGFKPR